MRDLHSNLGIVQSLDPAVSDVLGAAVDGSGIFALVDDSSEDGQAFAIGYVGNARYCRVQVELTGTHSNGTPVAALALLGHGSVKPVS